MNKKGIFGLFLFLMSMSLAYGQMAWQTQFYQDVSGQHQLHPRFKTDTIFHSVGQDLSASLDLRAETKQAKIVFSAAGMGSYFSNSLSFSDLSSVNSGVRTIDFDLTRGQTQAQNFLAFESQLNLLHIDYRLGKGFLRGGYTYRTLGNLEVSEAFFGLLSDGNEPFIGSQVSLSPEISLLNYHQIYLGYNYQTSNLSLSVQFKYLAGVGHLLSTEDTNLELSFSDDIFQFSSSLFADVQSSRIFRYQGFDNVSFEHSAFDFILRDNHGYALDFGANYQGSNGFRIFFNLYDLGSISWTNLTRSYTSDNETRSFNGLDLSALIDSDVSFEVEDSLSAFLDLEEDLSNYSASVPSQLVLGFEYQLSDRDRLGLVVNSSGLTGGALSDVLYGISLSGIREFSSKLKAGVSYTFARGVHGIGVNASYSIGKLNLVIAADHVPGLVLFNNSRMISLRGGASLAF